MKAFSLLKNWCWVVALMGVFTSATQAQATAEKGQELFNAKCASCHSAGKDKLTGPGLKGIEDRRSKEWLQAWIRNSQDLVNKKDPDAVAIFEEYNKVVMPPFADLKDEDIDALLAYIKEGPKAAPAATAQANGKSVHGSAQAQVGEWTSLSEGWNAETLVPLIVLPIFLGVVMFATQKIPGLKD
jgi:mono/diheme cytochrome c family protein